jgi:hypothetical protein
MDVGVGMNMCLCGGSALPDDTLCGRCRYIQNIFNPKDTLFESKRDKALRAIEMRRSTKGISRIVVNE